MIIIRVVYLAGKKRRLTLIECGNDLNTMIDIAKVADLVRIHVLNMNHKWSIQWNLSVTDTLRTA